MRRFRGKASLARLMSDPGRAKCVPLLECEKPGGILRWQLPGGDGVLKEGVPPASEEFPS